MSRTKLEVADIFRGHGPAWRQANAGHVSLEQLKVMSAIENCRTAGSRVWCRRAALRATPCSAPAARTAAAMPAWGPYRTLADLVNAARSKPGELTIASVGPTSQQHMAIESLKRMANIDLTYVPYSGSAPTVTAVLGGHVTALMAAYANLAEQVGSGKLRVLAAVPRTRIAQLPGVPTVAESGYKDFEVDSWFGVLAPAKTPKNTVAQFAGWFTAAMQVPEVKAKLVGQGLYPAAVCGADFGALLRRQYDEYGRLVREANIQGAVVRRNPASVAIRVRSGFCAGGGAAAFAWAVCAWAWRAPGTEAA
jgi:Tripartite tricarboxylate transporter family receptor